jgi:hypothetical protein
MCDIVELIVSGGIRTGAGVAKAAAMAGVPLAGTNWIPGTEPAGRPGPEPSVPSSQEDRMFECPHCSQPGITLTGRLFLGPSGTTDCTKCDKPVGADPDRVFTAASPAVASFFGSFFVSSVTAHVLVIVPGVVLSVVLLLTYATLVRR